MKVKDLKDSDLFVCPWVSDSPLLLMVENSSHWHKRRAARATSGRFERGMSADCDDFVQAVKSASRGQAGEQARARDLIFAANCPRVVMFRSAALTLPRDTDENYKDTSEKTCSGAGGSGPLNKNRCEPEQRREIHEQDCHSQEQHDQRAEA